MQRVLREGKRARTEHIEVRSLASLLHYPRIGIIVAKYGHSSVDRNRLKRRVRDIVRREILPVVKRYPADIIVRTSSRAYNATFEMLCKEVIAGVKQVIAGDYPEP